MNSMVTDGEQYEWYNIFKAVATCHFYCQLSSSSSNEVDSFCPLLSQKSHHRKWLMNSIFISRRDRSESAVEQTTSPLLNVAFFSDDGDGGNLTG